MKKPMEAKDNVLISVIIPCFNVCGALSRAVFSIHRQNYRNWEIIIVDADSSVRDRELIERLILLGKTRVIKALNRGEAYARNAGAAIAEGELLAFLDPNDTWHPSKLQEQYERFRSQPGLGVCYSKAKVSRSFDADSGVDPIDASKSGATSYDLFSDKYRHMDSGIICRKQVFNETGGFQEGTDYAEDQVWLMRVALLECWGIAFIPEFKESQPERHGNVLAIIGKKILKAQSAVRTTKNRLAALLSILKHAVKNITDTFHLMFQFFRSVCIRRRTCRQSGRNGLLTILVPWWGGNSARRTRRGQQWRQVDVNTPFGQVASRIG